jgi:hypothetical protein
LFAHLKRSVYQIADSANRALADKIKKRRMLKIRTRIWDFGVRAIPQVMQKVLRPFAK